ncbi:mechanosensitive ion channel family protein [Candidatus Bipolaricaulota bacterium]|jgi:small conductance mechanosensitive channel|nr:mechanosensitive ion channel family protein [Candidatus Bipolaricaulota bacterium]
MSDFVNWFVGQGSQIGPRIGGALLILFCGWLLELLAVRVAGRLMDFSRLEFSKLLRQFICKLVRWGIAVIVLIMALAQLGVHIGPLIAGLGVTGFILGFAMQQTLSNFAAGFMLLLYRPYDVGDEIEASGASGIVEGMNLVQTTLRTEEGIVITIPNGKIWGGVIKNKGRRET